MSDAEWTGRIVDGRYAVESVLGAGGMGLVLKARHKFTGAEVALKVLRPELQLDMEVQMRFLNEARAPNAIGHPGIVQVVDAGKGGDGLLYIVMELLQGHPLRVAMTNAELTHLEIRRIMMELFDALAAAHQRGFVHRDLKPENVFLAGPAGTVKLLDFGIAKVLDSGMSRVRTASGVALGTPAYMAPEQLNDASGVDARADLWAAGVMIYELLCGKLPFVGTTPNAMMLAVATQEPIPIRAYLAHAPPELEAFLARALSRDLSRRFASAQEMAHAFAALPLAFAPGVAPVQGTAPTVATGPAHAAALGYAPTHTPHHGLAAPGTTHQVTPLPQPPRSRAGLIVGIVGTLALVAAIGIVVASRGGDKPVATAAPGDATLVAQTTDAAAPPPIDAAVAASPPVDAGVVDASAVAEVVDAGVRVARRDAGVRVDKPRVDAGVTRADAGVAKVEPKRSACAPSGTASCREAMNCQRDCEDEDQACRCRCSSSMHPAHRAALAAFSACAKNCGYGKVCLGLNCKKVIATCLGR